MSKITSFLLHKADVAESSKGEYAQVLKTLSVFTNKDVDDCTEDDVLAFLQSAKSAGNFNHRLIILRMYYKFTGAKTINKALKELKKRKVQAKPFEIRDQDLNWMIEACKNPRDKAIVATLAVYGFREAELVSVINRGVEFDDKLGYGYDITCRQSKTQLRKVSGFAAMGVDTYISSWLDSHPKRSDPNAPFICAIQHKKIKDKGVWREVKPGDKLDPITIAQILKVIERRARLDHPDLRHISPHSLRHWSATQAVLHGFNNISMLMQRYGWKTPNMAERYVHVNDNDANIAFARTQGIEIASPASEPNFATCPKCKAHNRLAAVHCDRCGTPMNWTPVAPVLEPEGDSNWEPAEGLADFVKREIEREVARRMSQLA